VVVERKECFVRRRMSVDYY